MNNKKQGKVLEQFRRRHLHSFYVGFTQRFHPAHFEACNRRMDANECRNTVERTRLIKRQGLESLDIEEEREMNSKHWPFDDFDANL